MCHAKAKLLVSKEHLSLGPETSTERLYDASVRRLSCAASEGFEISIADANNNLSPLPSAFPAYLNVNCLKVNTRKTSAKIAFPSPLSSKRGEGNNRARRGKKRFKWIGPRVSPAHLASDSLAQAFAQENRTCGKERSIDFAGARVLRRSPRQVSRLQT